jgi:hypothetical protein
MPPTESLAQLGGNEREARARVQRLLIGDRHRAAIAVEQPVALEHEPTLDEAWGDGREVLGGSGRAPERDRELLGRHAVQVDARPVDVGDRHRCTAGAARRLHAGRVGERGRHRLWSRAAGGYDVDVAHRLTPPAQRAGELRVDDVGV